MGFDSTDAEDLTQEVFVTFLETLDRFEGRAQIRTWLFGILIRKAQERRRARLRDQQHDALDEGFESRFDAAGTWVRPPVSAERLTDSAELRAALAACLGSLPAPHMAAFHLREVEAHSAADTARLMGITVNHVGVLFHRARLLLRKCLAGKGHGR